MGSENNMVAVQAAIEALEVRPVHDGYDERGNYIWQDYVSLDEVRETLARLASPQPDPQQGEDMKPWPTNGEAPDDWDRAAPIEDANGDIVVPRHTARGMWHTIARYTPKAPPSPALDAATIERCARDANEFAEVARQDGFDGADALDLIEEIGRTLAKASTIERDQDDLDTPEARLAMVRVAVWHITQGGNAAALAKAALDFIDLTAAQRAEMRGDAA